MTLARPLGRGRAAPFVGASRGRGLRAETSGSRIAARLDDVLGSAPRSGPAIRRLRTEGVGKRYGETVALRGVSVALEPGTVHTVLGENGSGKSTLLKLLSGVARPSEGRILLDGEPVRAGSPRAMQSLGVATVFQEVLVSPHRSVTENVLLGYDGFVRRHMPRARRASAVAAVLGELSGTEIDLRAPAGELPLATRQLVVLARALVRLPSVLLLDEATAALDLRDRDRVFEVIADHARGGNLVVFVSHRLDEVRRLSDRVSVLRNGELIETLAREEATGARLLRLMAPEARNAG